jgi:hypothetical protein
MNWRRLLMDNVVEKIRKLLAKATSQNEHEAQAALLKARELMAKHKISEKEIGDAKPANRKLTRVIYEDKTYSQYVNTWFANLGIVIAEAHCCACLVGKANNSVKRYVQFTGLDDDPIIALEVFRYAVQHIQDRVMRERKYINAMYPSLRQAVRNKVRIRFERSYAEGFINGLKKQYDEQMIQENNECMALVMVMPKEVTDFISTLKGDKLVLNDVGTDVSAYMEGKEAGYKFQPTKQITGEQEAAV